MRLVRYLIGGDKAYPESAGSVALPTLVACSDLAEAMKVAPVVVIAIRLPGTSVGFDRAAIAEYPIVVYDQGVLSHIEDHFVRRRHIIGILDQFMNERAITLKVA